MPSSKHYFRQLRHLFKKKKVQTRVHIYIVQTYYIAVCTMKYYYLLRVFVSNWTIIMEFFITIFPFPVFVKNTKVNGLICRFLVFLNVCILVWFIALGSDAKKTFAQNHCPLPSYASPDKTVVYAHVLQ